MAANQTVQNASKAVLTMRRIVHQVEALPPTARVVIRTWTKKPYVVEDPTISIEEFWVTVVGLSKETVGLGTFTVIQQKELNKWVMGFNTGKVEQSFNDCRLYIPFPLSKDSVKNRKKVPKGKLQMLVKSVVEKYIGENKDVGRFGLFTVIYADDSHGAISRYEIDWVDHLVNSPQQECAVELDNVRKMRYVFVPSDMLDGWILYGTFGYRFEHPTKSTDPHVTFYHVGYVDVLGKITFI